MRCETCGHENPPEANFCSSCGAALVKYTDDATITFKALDLSELEGEEGPVTQLNELTPGDAMLLVKRGDNTGATYLLDTDVVRVGRHPDNEVFLDDVTVSRRHAEFRRDGAHFVIHDAGSLNGSYLNGDRVDTAVLEHGDEVQIGKYKLVFLTGPSER